MSGNHWLGDSTMLHDVLQNDPCPMFEAISSVIRGQLDPCRIVDMSGGGNGKLVQIHGLRTKKAMLSCNNKSRTSWKMPSRRMAKLLVLRWIRVLTWAWPWLLIIYKEERETNKTCWRTDSPYFGSIEGGSNESWRRDILDLRRAEMIDYGHFFGAKVIVQQQEADMILDMGILSGQDNQFFSRLVNVTNEIHRKTGLSTTIRQIEGGVEEIDMDQQHMDGVAGRV